MKSKLVICQNLEKHEMSLTDALQNRCSQKFCKSQRKDTRTGAFF